MSGTYRIIVGVDGSDSGRRALEWAVGEVARRAESGHPTSVQAITAYEYLAGPMRTGAGLPDPAAVAEQTLTEAITSVGVSHPGTAVAGEAVHGIPAEILGHATADADLLVLGSHGHSRLHTAVLGSVAEACVRAAACPVLIIPAVRSTPISAIVGSLEPIAGR